MKKLRDHLQLIIAVGVIIGMLFGAVNYFATAKDLAQTQQRLDQKIQSDQIMDLNRRAWQLEDRNGGTDTSKWGSKDDKDEYRKIKEEVEMRKKSLPSVR